MALEPGDARVRVRTLTSPSKRLARGQECGDRVCELADNAEALLTIDLIRMDEASAEFRDEILREGRTLYARPNSGR